jgi:hypothetical protein
MSRNSSILVISDNQLPCEHPDDIAFIKAVAKKHKIDLTGKKSRIIHIGDEVDNTRLGKFDDNQDMLSDGDELDLAADKFKQYQRIMPKMDIMISNHLVRYFKLAKRHGFSQKRLKPLHALYGLKKGYVWHKRLILDLPNTGKWLFQHGHQGDAFKISQLLGISVVSGHIHTKAYIHAWKTLLYRLVFACQTGCMIDNNSGAYDYDKDNKQAPVHSLLVIINGMPHLEFMLMDKKQRWIGKLV